MLNERRNDIGQENRVHNRGVALILGVVIARFYCISFDVVIVCILMNANDIF